MNVKTKLSTHVAYENPDLYDRARDVRFCRCGVPMEHSRHLMPTTDPAVLDTEARRLGERPD